MSFNYMLRDQFKVMSHVGTPNLCQTAKLQRIRDITRSCQATAPDNKFKEVKTLFELFDLNIRFLVNTVIEGLVS